MQTKFDVLVELEQMLSTLTEENINEITENIIKSQAKLYLDDFLTLLVRLVSINFKNRTIIAQLLDSLITKPDFNQLKQKLFDLAFHINTDNGRFLDNKLYLILLRACFELGVYRIEEILPIIKSIDSEHNAYKTYLGIFFLKEIHDLDSELFESIKISRQNPGYIFESTTKSLPSIDQLIEKDYFYLNNILNFGNHDPLLVSIINDDLDKFVEFSANDAIDFTKLYQNSIFSTMSLSDNFTLLNFAAANGSLQIFKYICVTNPNFDSNSLESAIIGGNIEIIRICIQHNCHSTNALAIAAVFQPILMDWLLENYIEEQNRIYSLQTAYIESIKSASLNSILFCIKNGIDVNYDEPIFHAGNNAFIVEFLLSIGVNISYYAFSCICGYGYTENVKVLLKSGKIDKLQRGFTQETALYLACTAGRTEIVKLLLDYGFDVDEKNYRGETALIAARNENRQEIVEILLQHKANTNIQTNQEPK